MHSKSIGWTESLLDIMLWILVQSEKFARSTEQQHHIVPRSSYLFCETITVGIFLHHSSLNVWKWIIKPIEHINIIHR